MTLTQSNIQYHDKITITNGTAAYILNYIYCNEITTIPNAMRYPNAQYERAALNLTLENKIP
jgi:hypothetical protein